MIRLSKSPVRPRRAASIFLGHQTGRFCWMQSSQLDPPVATHKNEAMKTRIDLPDEPSRRHQCSELPVARAATGRTLPALTNEEVQRILDEEEAAGGRSGGSACRG